MQAYLVRMAKSNTSRTGSLAKHFNFMEAVVQIFVKTLLGEGLFQHHPPRICGAEKKMYYTSEYE